MKVISDIEAATRANVRDVDNWLARLDLHTAYETSTRGRRRRFTYDNAFELSLLSALVKVGVRPSTAVAYAAGVMRQFSSPTNSPRRFLVIPDANASQALSTDDDDIASWRQRYPEADTFAAIDVLQIESRVSAFFDEHGTEGVAPETE